MKWKLQNYLPCVTYVRFCFSISNINTQVCTNDQETLWFYPSGIIYCLFFLSGGWRNGSIQRCILIKTSLDRGLSWWEHELSRRSLKSLVESICSEQMDETITWVEQLRKLNSRILSIFMNFFSLSVETSKKRSRVDTQDRCTWRAHRRRRSSSCAGIRD